jgi:hypothetical protein
MRVKVQSAGVRVQYGCQTNMVTALGIVQGKGF